VALWPGCEGLYQRQELLLAFLASEFFWAFESVSTTLLSIVNVYGHLHQSRLLNC
jgi:hypothetical protein